LEDTFIFLRKWKGTRVYKTKNR